MIEGCINDCVSCGKCEKLGFSILDGFDSEFGHTPREGTGIAIDIGTTSVAALLLDLSTGEVLARRGFMNPQRKYGADVISRIKAAGEGRLADMRVLISEALLECIRALLDTCGIRPDCVAEVSVACNTVMAHLLLGLPCQSLGVYPFKPQHTLKSTYTFEEVFGNKLLCCNVRIINWLAGFIGGDITAGLTYVLRKRESCFLLIDLGTNGEIALFSGGRLIITATAAGPAFEGGRNGGASYILDTLAELVREGIIDEAGRLSEGAETPFTQKDIRDLQLAKSAVRSGLEILLETGGLHYGQLGAVYLAGGIGQALNVESAVAIGLLPSELASKAIAVGNASLGGAAQLLLSPESAEVIGSLINCAEEVNLSTHKHFNDYFMDYMYF